MEQKVTLRQTKNIYPVVDSAPEIQEKAAEYNNKAWSIRRPLNNAYYAIQNKINSIASDRIDEIKRYTSIQHELSLLIELLEENGYYSEKESGELSFLATVSRVHSQIPDCEKEALAKITNAAQIPLRGIKTTWRYNLAYFLKESFDIPNVGPEKKHVAVVILKWVIPLLLIFLGAGSLLTAASFLWPLAVAGAGLFLLMFAIEKINKSVFEYLPFEVIDYNEAEYSDYQKQVLDCFDVELQLAKGNNDLKQEERSSTTPTKDTSYNKSGFLPQTKKEIAETNDVIDPKDVPQHQQNYTAVNALSVIQTRFAQCHSLENFNTINQLVQQQLYIKNIGEKDNSYLEYSVAKKDEQKLTDLSKVIQNLFPDILNICTITEDNKQVTLTISHEKTQELFYAEDFSPEEFLDAMKKNDSTILKLT